MCVALPPSKPLRQCTAELNRLQTAARAATINRGQLAENTPRKQESGLAEGRSSVIILRLLLRHFEPQLRQLCLLLLRGQLAEPFFGGGGIVTGVGFEREGGGEVMTGDDR